MKLTLGEAAAHLHTSCESPERIIQGYSIDSRTIKAGQLFFAIRGPHFDGHQYVAQALQQGAVGAVVEQGFRHQAPTDLLPSLLPVPDTLLALQNLAREVRRRWGGRIIAVTGSTGKSTTKEMIAALLSRKFEVLKSPGNLNNHYGLPLALLALESVHEVAVVELGMSAAGEIACLAQVAEPEMGVVTNVAPVHLQFFDSVDAIADAKRELIEHLGSHRESATAVLNYDDERVRKFAEGFTGRVVTFGFSQGADIRAIDVKEGDGIGSEFRVEGQNFNAWFNIELPGRHNIQNALAAISVARLFGETLDDLRQGLLEFQNLHQRGEILTLPEGVTIINDSYNSNPLAMQRMLETLAKWPGARRRIVVAGEMLELGPTSPDLHRDIGRKCVESGVSWLVAVQGDAKFMAEGAFQKGFARDHLRFYPDARQAGEFCRTLIKPGDVILVKGSRGVHLETVIELLHSTSVGAPGGPVSKDSEPKS
jgi:UDP-N-acetylmuramoyl-tripeptide--D-alanyl-D-alanine ligase